MYGVGILQYEPYLDGGNNTWTGSFTLRGETYNFTNIRYGAQPWAETENASKKIAHEGEGLDKGPLAGAQFTISVRNTIVDYASNKYAYAWGENVSSGSKWGEFALTAYEASPGHLAQIIEVEHQCIGIGISGTYHSEMYGRYD